MYRGEDLTILKSRRQWFDPAAFERQVAEKKQTLREAGAPGALIRQFDATLPRTRGLELAMVEEASLGAAHFAELGFIMDRGTTIVLGGPGAIRVTLRDPATGRLVEESDSGLLVRSVSGNKSTVHDTTRSPVHLSWNFQRPEIDHPSTVYARFAHRYDGWEIVSVDLVDARIQVITIP